MRFLLDSDTINYVLRHVRTVATRYAEAIQAERQFVHCPVVHLEVTRHLHVSGATRKLREYNELSKDWDWVEFERDDWDLATQLWADRRRAGRQIADADLLIAVCARKTAATLVTNNTRHFEGLVVTMENWHAGGGGR